MKQPLTVKIVDVSRNVKLTYVERGDGSGVPVIFLHGYLDSWRSFELVLAQLP